MSNLKEKLEIRKENSSHFILDCLLCGKEEHMYINKESYAWDCKKCGESGSKWKLYSILGLDETELQKQQYDRKEKEEQLLQVSIEDVEWEHNELLGMRHAKDYLKNERFLNKELAEYFMLGYNKPFDAITIPYFKDNRLIGVKYRIIGNDSSQQRYLSATGSNFNLFNWHGQKHRYLLICEGEFDTMLAVKLLTNYTQFDIVGVSGKDNINKKMIEFFNKSYEKIYLMWDNDTASQETLSLLIPLFEAFKVFRVVLPAKDLTDWVKQGAVDTEFINLLEMTKPIGKELLLNLSEESSQKFLKEFSRSSLNIPSGYQTLDSILGGLRSGELTVLYGRQGSGKTSFSLSLINRLLQTGKNCLIGSFEMNIYKGIMPILASLSLKKYAKKDKKLFEEGLKRLLLNEGQLSFIDRHGVTSLNEIKNSIRMNYYNNKVFFVLLDHLTAFIGGFKGPDERWVKFEEALKEIKQWTIDYPGIHVVLITHPNKIPVYQGKKRNPTVDDLTGGAVVEKTADNIILVERIRNNETLVEVQKNRDSGKQGSIKFLYNQSTLDFVDMGFYNENSIR